ncbi:MAG: hypothetical protein HY738_00075 [Bacteroidia bacterium]|nr:hypothetical protein [Bacteroidia bacterium]
MTIEKKVKQLEFLKIIGDIIPSSSLLVNELSDILGISNDSAYRRIRCETAMSIDEVALLCAHFNISYDISGHGETTGVTFNFTRLSNDFSGFEKHLSNILRDVNIILNAKEKQIIYISKDIPLFHYFRHRAFSSFKMFYWIQSVMNAPELEGKKFSVNEIPEKFHKLGLQLYEVYIRVPSIEIWTHTTISSAIMQIEFYWEAGLFDSKQTATEVCDDLERLLLHVQKQAELSTKFDTEKQIMAHKDNFTFYSSDIEVGNNYVLVKIGNTKIVYHNYHTFYIMSTLNNSYIEATELWINNIIKKATLISGISEKHRNKFFQKSFNELARLKEIIMT